MKLAESLLAVLVLGLAGFIGVQAIEVRSGRPRTHAEAAGAIDAVSPVARNVSRGGARREARSRDRDPIGTRATDRARGVRVPLETPDLAPLGMPTNPMPTFADASTAREMRRRIRQGAAGTYIGELLVSRDSALARWPDRTTRPLRVFVDEPATFEAWNAEFADAVRDAFSTWTNAGIPVHFDFVRDAEGADIEVRFTERLANGISGKTVWSRDGAWWLVSSDIQLALLHPSGGVVTAMQMRAIALHEVGHLLGLDHTAAPEHIMSPRVRVRELSDEDRATVRLLYSMPAGSIK